MSASIRLVGFGLFLLLLAVPATKNLRGDESKSPDNTLEIEKDVTQGALRIFKPDGIVVECPLKHTDVQADIAGFLGRVQVTQTFHNPAKEKIEAVYVFPLPHEAAVDQMTMQIDDRKIVGLIKRRAEARAIYDAAVHAGQTAALLEQERPNIFTQSVGNIQPGQEVKIQISYVDPLRYDNGNYEFQFPMVVGPRYIPGAAIGSPEPRPKELAGKVSPPVPDTDRVPDASRITPPSLKPEFRNGHEVSISVKLDAGVPIQSLGSSNHKVEISRKGERAAAIKLSSTDTLPNKDFVLRYGVVGKKPEMAVLAHTGDYSGDRKQLGNGYFMLMIQPKEDERLTKSPPREIVFLIDVSGSMSGEPTAKVIEAMQGMLKLCRPQDTLQVITFASHADKLFEKPVPAIDENKGKALGFTSGLKGGGGTEMLKGVKLAIDEPIDKERLRIVVMLTDGYIGNEAEIIEHVGKHCGDQVRFWCVGIGASPNMFLVDGVARQGGGMGKQLGLKDDSIPLVQEIMTRIQRAQLAKVRIDWGDLKVSETYPAKIPELWAGRPVIVYGRYSEGSKLADGNWQSEITVSGNVEGEAVRWPLTVNLPKEQKEHDALAKVWARQKIEDLMQQSFYQDSPAVEEMVTGFALDYRLMSQYTSFVAVDSKAPPATEPARPPRKMLVPLPLPDGTQWEGFFGDEDVAEGMQDRFSYRAKDVKKLAELSKNVTTLGRRTVTAGNRPSARMFSEGLPLLRARAYANPTALSAPTVSGAFGMAAGFGGREFASGKKSRGGEIASRYSFDKRGLALSFDAVGLQDGELDKSEAEVAASAFSASSGKLAEAAAALLATATGDKASKDTAVLRVQLLQAFWLDTAATNSGHSNGNVAAQALERLEKMRSEEVKAWIETTPQLKQSLDLVLRDLSTAEALAAVAKAAKLEIKLVPGSTEDVSPLLATGKPRINYLDLRQATVVQALDWILQPARLTWYPEKNGIVASSERRRNEETGWVYHVASVALPLEEDLKKLNDQQKAFAEAQLAVNEFLAAVRKELNVDDESSVVWFAPGQLLVFGTSKRHAQMAKAIEVLQQGKAASGSALASLTAHTHKRFAARKEKLAKAGDARAKRSVAMAFDQFSWQLLASSAAGQTDLEGLTELQFAWKSSQSAELLSGLGRQLGLRTLWCISEAARKLPADKELVELASLARDRSRGAADEAVKSAEMNRADAASLLSVLYAALALPDDRTYQSRAKALVTSKDGDAAPITELCTLGRILLGSATETDRDALATMFRRDQLDADQAVLLALACRQSGSESWNAFRAHARDLLGNQPLPGEIVVYVNRLN